MTDQSILGLIGTLNNATPMLNKLVLMPVGDVYAFSGLDETDAGHVLLGSRTHNA